jgi:MraZ protein
MAADLEPDRQGRILLPQKLRDFAGINGEAIIVGMYNYVEIWDSERWQAARTGDGSETDGERWADLGI